MKKIIWILLLMMTSLFSAEIQWEKSYQKAASKAAMSKKPMLFVLSSHHCKWCRHLEKTTFKDPAVIKRLNKEFISLTIYTDERTRYPRELYKPGTPAIWILDSKGEPLFDAIQGAVDAENFLQALEIVKTKFDKLAVK